MSSRRGLCVGINKFANIPTSNWLSGCVNDAHDMAALLKDDYGFGTRDVRILTDAKATKAAVMDCLDDLVRAAEAGRLEHLVFSYSSHGTQVPDANGDEFDRVDEALVSYDMAEAGDAWDLDTVVVDDELRAMFDRVPDGVLVEVFLDTCHSGTGLRAMDLLPGRRPKFLPPPTPAGLDDVADRDLVSIVDEGGRRRVSAPTGPVLFAACRSDQTASDARFEGRFNGAFTYFLIERLRRQGAAPRATVAKDVRARLRTQRFSQSPQLESRVTARQVPVGQSG
jgi:hypothetical protein